MAELSSMQDSPGSSLISLIEELGCSYGLEKSVKFLQLQMLSGRLLLTIHKDALGAKPEQVLSSLLMKLDFPNKYMELLISRISAADIVHFGYEDGGEGFIYKCYLEFIQKRPTHENTDQHLLHYAVKWVPKLNCAPKISYYHLPFPAGVKGIKQYISDTYRAHSDSTAYRMILEIMTLDGVRKANDELMLLLVSEQANERQSFDINLYNTDLCLLDISSQLQAAIEYFNVNDEHWSRLYDACSSDKLGHIAAGFDGKGREFMTVYFGVQEGNPGLSRSG